MRNNHPAQPPTRIAVVSERASVLPRLLDELAHHVAVQTFGDLIEAAPELLRYRPRILIVQCAQLPAQQAGALRLLRSLHPELLLVLACEADHEVRLRETAEQLEAQTLLLPCARADLAALLDAATRGSARPSADALLDLARGISDEINNPLMFTAGHVQLLQQSMRDQSPEAAEGQLATIRDGLQRITATMDKIRLLARAEEAMSRPELVDLGALAAELEKRRADGDRGLPPIHSAGAGPAEVWGDRSLLAAMLEDLGRVTAALRTGDDGVVEVEAVDGTVRVRATLAATHLPAWQLPRSFEPYYINRVLRSTPHGLSLFLVQVVAHGHGGQALALWSEPGQLSFRIDLPRATD